jgi:anaerobic selenocysteine-containing dehydrogenase
MAEGQSFKGDLVSFYYISFLFILLQYTYTPFSCLNCHVTCPFKHKRDCGGVVRASNGKQGWQEECTARYQNHESAIEHYTSLQL